MAQMIPRQIVFVGCGKMGSAMLSGWLSRRSALPSSIWVHDPQPSNWLLSQNVHLNQRCPSPPDLVVLAVKPQVMSDALQLVEDFGSGNTLFVSIAAGKTIGYFENKLGCSTPIIRAMPNTPAAIGAGITALISNGQVHDDQRSQATALLETMGQVVWLEHEAQMDAVTGVSGSGPAYVFLLIEALAEAGEAQGLDSRLAMELAKVTVSGSAALATGSTATPTELRQNVTSPNGTTQEALKVLMNEHSGMATIMKAAVAAASERSRELSRGQD